MHEGRNCFEAWADIHEWSDWTKPTAFAGEFPPGVLADRRESDELLAQGRALLERHADRHLVARGSDVTRNCVVVDCVGADAIAAGAALAARGFAPVVLFNGVTPKQQGLVDNSPAVRALIALAPLLNIEPNPAPAFLLDSRRLDGKPEPGRYDNRWITFPQDFPSAGRLQAAGIKRCLVLTEPQRIADDLAHVLRRWQDAGIEIQDAGGSLPARLDVKTPPWFRQVFYRSLALAGLKANAFGGFGALIPIVRAGGRYG